MVWYYYLPQVVTGIITLCVMIFSYFLIKRKQPENLNSNQENKMVDINNLTRCSGYGSTVEEMQESKNYTQDVLDTFKCNSDSHSSIMSWESCHEGISHSELDFVNCTSSENHPEICEPLNLCMRDKKNETYTDKITRTFFTDRKHKNIKDIQKKTPEIYSVPKIIEDYDQISSIQHYGLKDEFSLDNTEHKLRDAHNLESTEVYLSSTYGDELENEYNLNNTEQELKNDNNLEISEISAIHNDKLKDTYSLDITEYELKNRNKLEITKLFSTYGDELEDEYNLDNTKEELKDNNNLVISEISAIHNDELKDEYSLDITEYELKNKNKLEITKLSSTYGDELEDEYNLDNTKEELKDNNNLAISEISAIHNDELKDEYSLDITEYELKNKNKLEITKLSSTYGDELEDEYNLDNTKEELKDNNNLVISEISAIHNDELKDEYSLDITEYELKNKNKLEITKIFATHNDELKDEYSLDNTENSSNDDHVMLANVLETTGLSPIIHQDGQNYDYKLLTSPELSSLNNEKSISIDSPIHGCCNTCSSECSESLPSPIFHNDDNDSDDDIRYVEDYSDISFFDPTSDDAMNEAFVIVEDV